MRYSSLLLRHLSFLALLAITPVLKAEKLVIAHSTASRDYLEKRMVDGKPQRQTYVFMPGRYFAGTSQDKSLEKLSFRTIAERLALDLQPQNFHPATSLAKADLLLIVHWGVTFGRNGDSVAMASSMENLAVIGSASEETERQAKEASERGDFQAAVQAKAELEQQRLESQSEYKSIMHNQPTFGEDSAMLLGLSSELVREDASLSEYERRKALFDMTREERYFVIVMAFDAPTLISTKKLKRLWTLRVSISSAGINFPQALDRIGNIAGRYSGTRQERLTFDYVGDRKRTERVELGELIVLGPANP